jgi:hypothetical protein
MELKIARQKTLKDLKPQDFNALSIAAQRGAFTDQIKYGGMLQRRRSSATYDPKTGEIVRQVDPNLESQVDPLVQSGELAEFE